LKKEKPFLEIEMDCYLFLTTALGKNDENLADKTASCSDVRPKASTDPE
jgi:hypothetical protein